MRRAGAAVLVAAFVALVFPMPSAGGAPSTADVVWWGPTEVDVGWHMRVLVEVSNPYGVRVVDAPVAAELDLGRLLVEAGWPSVAAGDRSVPDGFELDLDSVRVVEMTSFEPPKPGTSDGRLVVQDRGVEGDARYEVPRIVQKGLLGVSDRNDDFAVARSFDARTFPSVTVFFQAPGETASGQTRSFVVYFDSVVHGDTPGPDSRPVEDAALQSLHWSGPGVRLYGHATEASGPARTVQILGLHPETTVRVFTLQDGVFAEQGDPVLVEPGEKQAVSLGSSAAQIFRLEADKPVLAYVQPVGYVPTVNGGYVGHAFSFSAPPAADGGNGLYIVNVGENPTQVRLRSADGSSRVVHLSDAVNGLPYGGSRTCGNDGGAWVGLPPGGRDFTASVVEGGPVMVQVQPLAMTHAPSTTGAPAGPNVLAAAQWTTPSCGTGQGQHFYALSEDGPGKLTVRSLETPIQVFPQGSPGNPTPDGRALPAAPDFAGPFDLRPSDAANRDRPLLFQSTNDLRVFVGGPSPTPQIPAIAGPVGGTDAGLNHAGFGEAVVLVPYPNTHLSVRVERTLSGVETFERDRGQDDLVRIRDDGSDQVRSFTVNATRPVVVYPTRADPGFLAGVPSFLEVDPVATDFRGRLIALESESGVTPMTGSVRPGDSIVYTMHVANLGRGVAGQDVTEAVRLVTGNVPTGWTAVLDRDSVTVAPGQRETVRLTVTPPADAASGQAVVASVHAFSEANPDVRDVLDTVTSVQRTFAVGLWFEFVDGPKTLTQHVGAGQSASFDMVVQNKGSTRDTIRVDAGLSEPGWDLVVVDDQGIAAEEVDLPPGGTASMVLRVTAPADAKDAVQFATVTAQSGQASSAFSRVTAITKVRAPTDVVLEPDDPIQRVADGGELVFPITLRNAGEGAAEVTLRLENATPPAWPAPELFARSPAGERVPVDTINLVAGEEIVILAAQKVPANATAGTLAGLRVSAGVQGSQQSPDALLTGIVDVRHDLRVEVSPEPPLRVAGAGAVGFELGLENRGNLNETLQVKASALPAGWTVGTPSTVVVAQGGSVAAAFDVRAPLGFPHGAYNVTLSLASADGNITAIDLDVEVEARLAGSDYTLDSVPAHPGASVPVAVAFHNDGNVPVGVRFEPNAQEPWTVVPGARATVAPGANATVEAVVDVPRDAPDGRSMHRASIRVEEIGGTLAPALHEVRFDIDSARVDLRIGEASAAAGPSGVLVYAVVVNDGVREVRGVSVALVGAEGDTVAEQTIGILPPSGSASVLLAASDLATGSVRIVVDPDDAVVEADERNNAQDVTLASVAEASLLPVWLVVSAVVFAVVRKRLVESFPGK